ncbi:MAG TPA: carboxypeptidase-like regulatory domain-containing protein, partial [Thermoanaerobaculia bacterium]|nr:carboxypeptidase-like regulatory domain-containing protein [Thermoanaerobaculia bacterium]
MRKLLVRTEGRVCARLYRRADGTVLTRDCPTGLRALRRRASRVAAAWITALLSVASFACGSTTWKKSRPGSSVKLEIERVAAQQPAVLTGVVRENEGGNPLPGVSVKVRNEATAREITAVTDVYGEFTIASLDDGMYRVEVTLDGLEPATMEHVPLKASEVT